MCSSPFPQHLRKTFGLTPIEAMAAGLPLSRERRDGYMDTVRDGEDGPRHTWQAPAPLARNLIYRQ